MTCVSSAHALLHALRTIPRRSSVHCIPIAQRRNVRCRLVGLTLLAPALFFAQCPLTVNAGPDQFACTKPATFSLNGSISGSYQSFLWSPTTGMTGANTLSPTVTVSQTTSYVLRAKTPILSQNLILNGDFEQGNTGFSSDYIYNPGFAGPPNPPFGSYDVAPFPVTLTPCPDHTGGGNYMIVDGSEFPNKLVWCQTVPVTPNTEYMLSTWVTSINLVSPFAQLKFTVNGNFVGTITAPGQCAWIQFTGLWNSGASTSATICIEDLVVGGANNDFGIDDLGFYPTCVVTDTVTVHITNIQAVANPASVSIPCDGTSTTLNGAGSSTGPGITYLWDTPNGNIVSGETTLTPTVNATGAYTLTVTYNAGNVVCTKTATVNVLQSLNPLTTWITPPPPLGCGNTQVVLNGIASQTSVTYAWTTTNGNIVSGGNTSKATVDKPGLYLLTVTNSVTGCTATAQVSVIAVNNPPTANATALGTINCITKQVNLSGTGSSTGAGITYLWTTPNGTIVSGKDSIHAVASAGGAYILSVSLSNCISKDTVLVSADTALPVAVLKKPDTLTCRADTLVLSAQISPIGALPVWIASAGGHIASGDSTAAPKINSAGIYTLTVTNPANGCSTVMTDTVIANQTPPSAKIVQPPPLITCQIPQVMLSGAGSSTGSRFTYLWSGPSLVAGSTTLSPKVDQPGLYTLLVTDTLNGCVSSSAITVSADVNFIVATVQVNDTLDCVSNTVLLTSNGSTTGPNISYQWSIPAGIIVSNQTASTLAVNQADIYTLRVSDIANGCSATASVTVVKNNTPPIAQIQSPVVLTCKTIAQVLQAQASGGTSLLFSWGASNGGKIILGSNTLTPTVNAAGTYTLSVTNAVNGCTATQSVVVQQDTASPSAIILTPGKLDCNVKQLTLHTTGSSSGMDFSFQWAASNNGNIVSGSTGPSPLVDRAGHYALTVTNTTNGCTATATTQVQADAQLPDASIQTPGILTCQHPLDTLQTGNPDPSFTYQWMTTNGQFFSGQNSASPVVSAGGNYALTVTNPITGCSNEAVVTVLQNTQAPAVQIQTPAVLTCKIATQTLPAQVAGSGGFTYAWTASNGGNITSGSNTPTPTVDKAGTYTLLVSDPANGCTVTASIAVQQDTASPLAKIAPPAKITCKTKQLIINTAGSSSGPNFNFVWTASNGGEILSGANSPTPTVGKAGDYTLTLTNTANGCTTTAATSVLADEAPPGASILPPDSLTCAATQITLQAAAPNQNFTYQWTTIGGQFVSGQNTADPIVSATGSYSLTVTHPANGCSSTAAVQVYADKNIPPVAIAKPDTLTCILQQLTLVGSSNGSALSYAWSGSGILSGDNTLTPVVETAGTYTLTVRDLNNGCSATATVSVYSNTVAPLVTSISPKGILTCKTLSVNIFSSNTAIKPAYQWSGSGILSGDHSASPEVNIPGLYTVTVTNQTNGCTATATATVAEDKMSPVLSIPPPPPLTCAQLTVTLQGMVSQPASTFSAAWTSFGGSIKNGANTLTPEADEPGVYVLTVQYTHNGCTATASTTIL